MDVYKGISASGGIAVGESFCIPKNVKQSIEKRTISPEQLEPGWIAFETAQVQVADYFSSLIDAANAEQSAIFQTYILMLNDPEFVSQIKQSYERDLICIEAVVDEKSSEAANILMMSGDDYLMQRAADIVDVFSKVLDILTGKKAFSFADIPPGAIVFAHDIAPSDAGMLAKYSVKALVTEEGGQSSHLSIIARSYGAG
ncbi:MAG: phosphoenolpyruvate-utilizing N-terminal domain-containing protein, partial [Spirochaetales bacterium]